MTTFRCNLTCKGCLVGAPNYRTAEPDLYVDAAKRTFARLFQFVDFVDWLELTGGEALLNKELPVIIQDALCFSEQFNELRIYTNGTVGLSPKVASLLTEHNYKIVVHIADYGVNESKTAELIAFLQKHNINYVYKRYVGGDQYSGGWVDFGNYTYMNRSEPELADVFSKCGQKKMNGCFPIWDGKMHYCAYALRGIEQGLVPASAGTDYLDLFGNTISADDLRAAFIEFSNRPYFSACNYCTGNFGTTDPDKRYKAGMQEAAR